MRSRSTTPASRRRSKPGALRAAAVLQSIPLPVVVVDRGGHVILRNRTAEACFGEGDRVESLLNTVVLAPPSENWTTLLRRALSTPLAIELSCSWSPRNAAGSVRGVVRLSAHAAPPSKRAAAPPPEAVILTFVDAGAVQGDESIDSSSRLLSLGKLAARVAHELNNPLDGVIRFINLAMRLAHGEVDSKLKDYLFESRAGLHRMVRIVADLLEYSRTAGEPEELSVNDIVEQAIGSIAAAADDRRIVIAVDFQHRDMPKFRGTRLLQVLVNLLRNAIDAMPGGGRLTVTSGRIEGDVVLGVADTGPGLPHPIERVFEPFFTTKPPGKGTGLGLAICREFVEGMGGTIRAENASAGGAVFTLRVPAP